VLDGEGEKQSHVTEVGRWDLLAGWQTRIDWPNVSETSGKKIASKCRHFHFTFGYLRIQQSANRFMRRYPVRAHKQIVTPFLAIKLVYRKMADAVAMLADHLPRKKTGSHSFIHINHVYFVTTSYKAIATTAAPPSISTISFRWPWLAQAAPDCRPAPPPVV
jgi:hypothetical protein